MDCTITENYLREKARMCKGRNCYECPLGSPLNLYGASCKELQGKYATEAIAIVQKWSDEPKELSEFCKAGFEDDYTRWEDLHTIGVHGVGCVEYPKEPKIEDYRIKRPPQSWCYVEELEG